MQFKLQKAMGLMCLSVAAIVSSCEKDSKIQSASTLSSLKSGKSIKGDLQMSTTINTSAAEHIGAWYVTKTFYKNSAGEVQGCVVAVPDDYNSTTDLLPMIISEGGSGATATGNEPFKFSQLTADDTQISRILLNQGFNFRCIVISVQDNNLDGNGSFRGYVLDDLLKYMYGYKPLPSATAINNVQPNQNLTGLRINKDKVSLFMYSYSGNLRQFWTYNNPTTGRPWATDFPIPTPIVGVASYNGLNDGAPATGDVYKTMGGVVVGRGASASNPNCQPGSGFQWGFFNAEEYFRDKVKSIEYTTGSTAIVIGYDTYCDIPGDGHGGNGKFVNNWTSGVLGFNRTSLGLPTAN